MQLREKKNLFSQPKQISLNFFTTDWKPAQQSSRLKNETKKYEKKHYIEISFEFEQLIQLNKYGLLKRTLERFLHQRSRNLLSKEDIFEMKAAPNDVHMFKQTWKWCVCSQMHSIGELFDRVTESGLIRPHFGKVQLLHSDTQPRSTYVIARAFRLTQLGEGTASSAHHIGLKALLLFNRWRYSWPIWYASNSQTTKRLLEIRLFWDARKVFFDVSHIFTLFASALQPNVIIPRSM